MEVFNNTDCTKDDIAAFSERFLIILYGGGVGLYCNYTTVNISKVRSYIMRYPALRTAQTALHAASNEWCLIILYGGRRLYVCEYINYISMITFAKVYILYCLGTAQNALHITPGRHVHSNAISTSLGNIQRCCDTARRLFVHISTSVCCQVGESGEKRDGGEVGHLYLFTAFSANQIQVSIFLQSRTTCI